MPKPYSTTEGKREWAANVAAGLRRYAEVSRCPECKRKNAFHKKDEDFLLSIGIVLRKCRYCYYYERHDLETDITKKGFGKAKDKA